MNFIAEKSNFTLTYSGFIHVNVSYACFTRLHSISIDKCGFLSQLHRKKSLSNEADRSAGSASACFRVGLILIIGHD